MGKRRVGEELKKGVGEVRSGGVRAGERGGAMLPCFVALNRLIQRNNKGIKRAGRQMQVEG